MNDNFKVYIVLVNYNGWRDTIECLESLLKLEFPNFQVVVVDNCSPDGSFEHIVAWSQGGEAAQIKNPELRHLSAPFVAKPVQLAVFENQPAAIAEMNRLVNSTAKLVLIQAGANGGFSAGNNVGIRYALAQNDATHVWLLNNDTVVDPQALNELIAHAAGKRAEKVGLIGAKLLYYYAPEKMQAVGGIYKKWCFKSVHLGEGEIDIGQYDDEKVVSRAMDYPVGASMFTSVDFINDVGLMSEKYFLFFEEMDWVLRGRTKGWSVSYCHSARVYHKEGGSIGTSSKLKMRSRVAQTSAVRSRLVFVRSHYKRLYWAAVFFTLLYAFKTAAWGNRKNVFPMLRVLSDEVFGKHR